MLYLIIEEKVPANLRTGVRAGTLIHIAELHAHIALAKVLAISKHLNANLRVTDPTIKWAKCVGKCGWHGQHTPVECQVMREAARMIRELDRGAA